MRIIGRTIALVAMVVLLVVPIGGLIVYFAIRHDVDRASLSYSVAARLNGYAICRKHRGTTWMCVASPEQAPDVGPYEVSLSGHCWRASLERSIRGAKGLAAFHGCIGIWDQLRLGDTFHFSVRLPGYY